ncbi:MAG: monofunctional biosynthetic peptidoglycan transglycosylase [Pseudomonadota bacterium]
MTDRPWKRDARAPSGGFRGRLPGWGNKLRKTILLGFASGVLLSMGMVGCLRWINPPTSAFMIRDWFSIGKDARIQYVWIDMEKVAPVMRMAVVAAEDQKFPFHSGFDFKSISDAVRERMENQRIRGASTITQQVAKNLFLWPGQCFLRKGLEAYFTILIETLWPKRRILEIYLNIVEFGESTYGVSAAAQRFFRKPASRLTVREAALLAAVLPNPKRFNVMTPSAHVYARIRWIESQMAQLGGPAYLKPL